MKYGKKILTAVISLVLAVGIFFLGYFSFAWLNKDVMSLKFIVDTYEKYYYEYSDDYLHLMVDV